MSPFYRHLVRPLLFRLDPERAHALALRCVRFLPVAKIEAAPSLRTAIGPISLAHPVGLAAGFDKDGIAAGTLVRLGFSFIELGTVTALPQEGNPRPRLFRFPAEEALVNRMGFNNEGAEELVRRIGAPEDRPVPFGVNVGRQRSTEPGGEADDYRRVLATVLPAADYVVANISSPNTPGLRDLEKRERLADLVGALVEAVRAGGAGRRPPLFVKLSPDRSAGELEAAAATAAKAGVDGLIVTNTTTDLAPLGEGAPPGGGGLSGAPLAPRAFEALRAARRATGGELPLIASGGVFDADDVLRRIRAGASAVQIFTALVYEGPSVVRRIVRRLPSLLAREGFRSVTEAVGADD